MAPRLSAGRPLRAALVTAVALGLAAVAPAAHAAGVVDPAPIGPGQFFTGLVDDTSTNATIQMACYGAITSGETGHPLPGQSVEVLPAPAAGTVDVGYTGSAANRVEVGFGPTSVATPVVLGFYGVKAAIPTSLVLPCAGTGTVVFTPEPGSPSARAATLAVRYVGQP